MKKLRIAQIAPLFEPVPPEGYGGTQRVVYNLTEELVKRGHQVTLFASGDSKTSAKLIPICSRALRKDKWVKPEVFNIPLLDKVFSQRDKFDLIHSHIFTAIMPLNKLLSDVPPIVSTLHGRLNLPEYRMIPKYSDNISYVSISNSQRKNLPDLNYVDTVYNGIEVSKFEFNKKPKDYFIFLGRISPEKGINYALELAERAKIKLLIAAKVDPFDLAYYKKQVKPKITNNKLIQFVGEVGHREKVALLKNAKALINPINWEEPFGLTMIEAMACGTPVIAPRRASVPEIVVDNKTGFIVSPDPTKIVSEMQQVLEKIDQIDRRACRVHVEKNFTAKKMADGYEKVYQKVLEKISNS